MGIPLQLIKALFKNSRDRLNYTFHCVPKTMAFQLTELQNNQANVTCPYCEHDVIDWEQEQYIQPCQHTLFIAMDLGFEYISDEFEQTMQRSVDEIHADDENSHVFTEIGKSSLENFIIYKMDLGVEDMYRYLGFAEQI